jgi:hypothetical protein
MGDYWQQHSFEGRNQSVRYIRAPASLHRLLPLRPILWVAQHCLESHAARLLLHPCTAIFKAQ